MLVKNKKNKKHLRMPTLTKFLVAGLAGSLLSGCMTTRIEESKNIETGINDGESIVIIEASYHVTTSNTEDGFVDCVTSAVQRGSNGLNVYPDEDFVDALFPWFEPRTMPQGPESLAELLKRPGIATQLNNSGVRYIVWLNGDTERTNGGGSLSCAVGPGGGGCFGLAWWENDSSYEASVWDVRKGVSAGEVSAAVHGTSMVPALIIPLPFIARTQKAACKGLSRELRTFITGSGPS
jgi:hypothetical protein